MDGQNFKEVHSVWKSQKSLILEQVFQLIFCGWKVAGFVLILTEILEFQMETFKHGDMSYKLS